MLKLLKNLTKKDWIYAFICAVLVICEVWLELKMPDYMSNITQLVQTKGASITNIMIQGGYMLLCAFGSLICAIIVGYFVSGIAASFSMKTRKKLFTKVDPRHSGYPGRQRPYAVPFQVRRQAAQGWQEEVILSRLQNSEFSPPPLRKASPCQMMVLYR